jgi:hypothetical protein
VHNYSNIGDFIFSADLTAGNIWRENGVSAGRIDLYPKLRQSIGTDVVLSHMVAARETLYSFYGNKGMDDNTWRSAFEYDASVHTRLTRSYASFVHVIEPSINYHFISSSENTLPAFDATEQFRQTSMVAVSILNRAIVKGRELFTLRITQGVETSDHDSPFLPMNVELGIKGPFRLKMNTTYDLKKGRLETVNSEAGFNISKVNFTVGQTYDRTENIKVYRTGADVSLFNHILLAGQLWYDAQLHKIRDIGMSMKYTGQCWGVRLDVVKNSGDFSMRVLFELAGINAKSSPRKNPEHSPFYTISDKTESH